MVYAKEAVGIEQSVDTGAQATLNSVLEIYEREVYETYRLTIDGEEIETTANHPFYTEDGEAVEAKDLKEGDKLSTADGESATVEQTEKVIHNEPVKVYNLAVLDTHTYYVGEVGVLVHNECTGESFGTFEKWGKNANEKIASKGWKVGEPINAPTKAGKAPSWTTVRNRYWKNEAALNPNEYSKSNLNLMKKVEPIYIVKKFPCLKSCII